MLRKLNSLLLLQLIFYKLCSHLVISTFIQSFSPIKENQKKYCTSFIKNLTIDHFSASTSNETFNGKFIYNIDYYKPGGLMFFQTGGEIDIEKQNLARGAIWAMAPLFNAAIIIGQHRYYSYDSQPFGLNTYQNIEHMRYLTSKQALADFADMIPKIKMDLKIDQSTKVIAFGESYGGMLAAWFRMKYPHIVHGAWASSAPMLSINGKIDPVGVDKNIKKELIKAGCNYNALLNAYRAIKRIAKRDVNYLNKLFRVRRSSEIKNYDEHMRLINFISDTFFLAAKYNYPYRTLNEFSIPPRPLEKICKLFQNAEADDVTLAANLFYAINITLNSRNNFINFCIDDKLCSVKSLFELNRRTGVLFQACIETSVTYCRGDPPGNVNKKKCSLKKMMNIFKQNCLENFKDIGSLTENEINFNALEVHYGSKLDWAENIIFTNGEIDPLAALGYSSTINSQTLAKRGVFSFVIGGASHSLDVQHPNTCDPAPLIVARNKIVEIINCWTSNEADCAKLLNPEFVKLPSYNHTTQKDQTCTLDYTGWKINTKLQRAERFTTATKGVNSITKVDLHSFIVVICLSFFYNFKFQNHY